MKFVVACGGTGGHSFPGLAAAEELTRRGHEVTVWVSGRDIESSVMRGWKGATFSTGARPLKLRYALSNVISILRCRRQMRLAKPDALLAMGSYASLPPVLAARSRSIPVVLHEANTVPGKAVDFLSRFATAVATSFDATAKYLRGANVVKTGLPVRADIAGGRRFDFIPADAFVVFVTGGSQGAHAVNALASSALVQMKAELDRRNLSSRHLYVIHQTGARDETAVKVAYAESRIAARVHAFEHEMSSAFASADIVIARAGASTCFELAACGKPAMLIPLPTAMRNHQHFNAAAFVAAGAADEGEQARLSVHQLCRYLLEKYDNPKSLAERALKMKRLATPDAAAQVASLLERQCERRDAASTSRPI